MIFEKVLVANRGEIAVRIIEALKEMDITSVAVYSTADENALHVRIADEAYLIGEPEPIKSYLNIEKIIGVAENAGVDAIHPGYGFLSENPEFARECERRGIIFIGPKSRVIRMSGDKIGAIRKMVEAGVPTIPGSLRTVRDLNEALEFAEELGYPILIKPAFGGGGIGIKLVKEKEELPRLFDLAQKEAIAAFGKPDVYIEKVMKNVRHIEMQIVADNYGNIVWLGERECSIQRRNQKMIEEAPSPAINEEERQTLGNYAIMAAKAIGYTNVGTIEFLYKRGNFYFLEVNARLQVEHGVTESITGIDLVKEQIRIAMGEKLGYTQNDIKINGWAIEARINAEDPLADFAPSPGKVIEFQVPRGIGIRVDTYLYPGYEIPPYYDSLVAKLIAWGRTRDEAISRMKRALDEFVIGGVTTTIPFYRKILSDEDFIKGRIDTRFLKKKGKKFYKELKKEEYAITAALTSIVRYCKMNGKLLKMRKERERGKKKRLREYITVKDIIDRIDRWAKKVPRWRKEKVEEI